MPLVTFTSRSRIEPLSKSAAVALVLVVLAGAACGGGGAKTPAKPGAADGGVEGGTAAQLSTSPPPSGLPAMATMPPPGVAGSKKAKRKLDAALAACGAAAKPQAKDPADHVKKVGESCASSKMKPAGAMLRGQQGDKDAHQEQRFRAEAGHCYRLYFAGDDAVKDVVVLLRDSAGDVVAESPGPAVPEDGTACFTASDEVSVLVSIGSGKGAWAAQVWSD